jgi:uncharacterized Fe-S radical SAM superfamily protein PflX
MKESCGRGLLVRRYPLQHPLAEQRPYRPPHVERHHAHEQASLVLYNHETFLRFRLGHPTCDSFASFVLERRVDRAMDTPTACVACRRSCETNRLSPDPKDWGECRVGEYAIVSSAFPHFGEEDCLVGTMGSGTLAHAI